MTWPWAAIDQIISYVNSVDKISDIHLAWWEYICFRQHGDIIKIKENGILDPELVGQMILHLMHYDQEKYNTFLITRDADFGYVSKENIPYRVNVFFRLNKPALVMRKINGKALDLEMLVSESMATAIKEHVLSRKKWLYLVTWPTWSWKSTSLVAMIEYLNQRREEHIITMEDPIEFIYEPKLCTISQRNIWQDSKSFKAAIKGAMREDPDIILVWEIRDAETADAALELSETWHLVFSTLHTQNCPATINRFISLFPPELQESVCDRLATSLIGVQSQMLVKKVGWWRIWIYEFMLNTTAVRNNIKKREIPQLANIIETWANYGMISMKKYAENLLAQGKVDEATIEFIMAENIG